LREDSTVSVEDAAKNGDEDAKRVLQENLQSYSNDEMSDRDVIGERTD
jgi:hypothetical protein